MKIATTLCVVVGLSVFSAASVADAQAPQRVPVIFDTDIGDDIDDTWALAMLLKSPQLDVKLITTTCGKSHARAKLIAKLLTVAGRTDIPIGLGVGKKEGRGKQRQEDWVKDYRLEDYPGKVHTDGVGAIVETIMKSDRPVTVLAVGPVPNSRIRSPGWTSIISRP